MKEVFLMLVGSLMLVGAAWADDLTTGLFTVTEMGFGRFKAVDQDGTVTLLHLSRGVTRFEPDQWQMHEGDKVHVEYWPTFRNRPTPTCVLIRLEEPGPMSRTLTNPLKARVEEMGRGSIRVRVSVDEKQSATYQFLIGRRATRYEPRGWVPRSGDSVVIHFSARPSSMGWGSTLIADRIEKLAVPSVAE